MASKTALMRPSRINITLDVPTNGATRKKELPMKCLVVGDFSQGNSNQKLSQRPRHRITPESFNAVLGHLNPVIHCQSGATISVRSLEDFHPERLVQQVPVLKRWVAMRHLLRELQGNLLDDRELQKRLSDVMSNPALRSELKGALEAHAPLQS